MLHWKSVESVLIPEEEKGGYDVIRLILIDCRITSFRGGSESDANGSVCCRRTSPRTSPPVPAWWPVGSERRGREGEGWGVQTGALTLWRRGDTLATSDISTGE